MTKITPREISERIKMFGSKWDYEVSIDCMSFDEMEELMVEATRQNPQYTKLYFDREYCGNSVEIHIRGVRLETTEEVTKRFQEEEDRRLKREELERKEYESLKKKFEKG